MRNEATKPKRLYKYRPFSDRTLAMVITDHVYFADPSTFNDPLDTQPSLNVDLDSNKLARVLWKFVERRTDEEMRAAAQTIGYRGPKTLKHIKRHSQKQADELIAEIKYLATEPDYDPEAHLLGLLRQHIEIELRRQFDKGIVSLAEKSICPLMWSHYGDQHRGICIGYSVPASATKNLHKVRYGGSRLVAASKVAAMADGDDGARIEIDEAVLFRKARNWSYEREWRLIGSRGVQNSPLELEEIVFGLKCDDSIKYAVVKALEARQRPIKFYEMREMPGKFTMKKIVLDENDELFTHFPRRFLSIYEAFKSVSIRTSNP